MQAQHTLADTATLKVSPELLAAARRCGKDRPLDFKVEAWKPTLWERLAGLFGRRSRAARPRATPKVN